MYARPAARTGGPRIHARPALRLGLLLKRLPSARVKYGQQVADFDETHEFLVFILVQFTNLIPFGEFGHAVLVVGVKP